jgi:queuine tRNA-ribosyltransferase
MKFNLTARDPKSKARAGTLLCDHGEIQTPIFMPVGTAGTVKAVHFKELDRRHQSTDHPWQYLPPLSQARA